MIPYLLAAVGGYLIGQSQKKDVPQMADGGEIRTLWLIKDNNAEMLMKGTPRSIKTFLNKEKKKSYRGEKSVYGNGSLEEWYQNTTKEEVLNHNRNYRSTDQSYADGGMMAKGGKNEDLDKVDSVLWENIEDDRYNVSALVIKFDEDTELRLLQIENGVLFSNWINTKYFEKQPFSKGMYPRKKFNKQKIREEVINLLKENNLDSIKKEGLMSSSLKYLKKYASGGGMMEGGGVRGEVKVGDKVKSKSGVEGEVYESTGMFFKLKDKYGNKSNKFHSVRDFKPSEIKSMAGGGTKSIMAEGGVLAHGLREDDKIYVERGNLAGIKNDKTDEKFIVDISTGSREKLKD